MNTHDDCALDEMLRAGLPDVVPPLVERHLRTQLADFRARVTGPGRADDRGVRRWLGPRVRRMVLAAAAAAVGLSAIYIGLRPGRSFADVAAEVLRQPWIHVRTSAKVNDKSQASEAWYSASRKVSATQDPASIQFHDHRLQLHFKYDPKEGTLYRLPEFQSGEMGHFESMLSVLAAVVRDERTLENPLESLPLFGNSRNSMKVIDQRLEKVTEKGETWLDYRLTVRTPEIAEPVEMLFRVDAQTKLLRLCRITGRHEGGAAVREMEFDYPETGPADIFALNVPRTARLVDRVPAGDLKRIVETLQAGRERMDSYRAIVVEPASNEKWWDDMRPRVFWRKGDRFRADMVASWGSVDVPKPAPDVNRHTWWQDRLANFRFYPTTVIRGPVTYRAEVKPKTDADGTEQLDLVAMKEFVSGPEMFPPEYSMMPEFGCRPPMGIGGQDIEPEIDLQPAEGPPGCILLNVWRKSSGGKGVGVPAWRYWLDPARDYIAMRKDMSGQVTLTEETARSPQGVWYATRFRREDAATRRSDGKSFDVVYQLYVDFDPNLPDAIFEVPQPGRIR